MLGVVVMKSFNRFWLMLGLAGLTVKWSVVSAAPLAAVPLAAAPLTTVPLTTVPLTTVVNELQVVTENWRPYNYLKNGKIQGVSTTVVKKVLKQAGIKYKIDVYPWARAYKLAQDHDNVLIYTIVRIAPREKLFKWVRPLGKGGTTFLYRLDKNPHINPQTLQAAQHYQVAANKDTMDHIWLRYQGFEKLQTPPTAQSILQMFFKGRTDMLAFDDATLKAELDYLGLDHTKAIKVMPLFKTPPYMAVSLGTSDKVVERLRQAYDSLLQSHQIELVN